MGWVSIPTPITMNKETRTANAIHQRGRWILIGLLPIYMRPVTYGQILDMRAPASEVESFELVEDGNNLFHMVFKNSENLRQKMEIAVIALFRRDWARRLFGGYIKHRMTDKIFKKIESFLSESIDPLFFYASTIFLSGVKEPKTDTTHGESYHLVENTTE